MNTPAAPDVLKRIRAEFVEMPGLALTTQQIGRLCGLELEVCRVALDELEASGFLSRRHDGAYRREAVDADAVAVRARLRSQLG